MGSKNRSSGGRAMNARSADPADWVVAAAAGPAAPSLPPPPVPSASHDDAGPSAPAAGVWRRDPFAEEEDDEVAASLERFLSRHSSSCA